MHDNLERLNKLSSSSLLRGAAPGSPESIDASSAVISDLKDVATSNLNFIEQMQELHMNGNKEALGGLMKSVLRDHKGIQQLVKEATDTNSDLALPDDMSLDNLPQGFDLESIPASVLADMFDPDMYDEIKEHARGLIPALGDAELALHDLMEHDRRLSEEKGGHKPFDFGPDYPSFGSSGSTRYARRNAGEPFKDFGFKFQHGGFNPHNLRNHPMIKNALRGMKGATRKGFGFPSHLKKYLKGRDSARRERRRRLQEEDPDCQAPCDIDDAPCNCQRLRDCVKEMQSYDFAVLFAGQGFINKEGDFTVKELKLFDIDDDLPTKIARIQDLAADESSGCNLLLEEFHSACSPDEQTCASVNDESFQLTVDQVCDAVNTTTFLHIEQIAEAYDGFEKLGGGPFINGTVDNKVVLDWYTRRESGEDYCGIGKDGKDIPTTCQVEWLDSKCDVAFGYWFSVNDEIKNIDASKSPNGQEWKWWECAHECNKNDK